MRVASLAGIDLDGWQKLVLQHALGEGNDGRWSARTVVLLVARQNGKNEITLVRELLGLFVLGERLIVHTAHEQESASEQFIKFEEAIREIPEFDARVRRPVHGKGSEAIELKDGARIRFRTRTKGGARGLSGDLLVFDEAYEVPEATVSAIVPSKSARPNPQMWWTSSAVDQEKHENGVALARQRMRGIKHRPHVAFFEWAAPGDSPANVPVSVLDDPEVWALANPALGSRILVETVRDERDGDMGPREFAVERLGIGDWPAIDAESRRVIPVELWRRCAEHDSSKRITSNTAFAVDVNPDRTWASIAVAGRREDQAWQFAVADRRQRTTWVVERCVDLAREHPGASFAILGRAPAASMVMDMEAAGLRVELIDGSAYGRACGDWFDSVISGAVRYPSPQPDLEDALAGAKRSVSENAWTWSRRASTSPDISPLVAVTLALATAKTTGTPTVWNLADFVQ